MEENAPKNNPRWFYDINQVGKITVRESFATHI